jgi:hypothetical protein
MKIVELVFHDFDERNDFLEMIMPVSMPCELPGLIKVDDHMYIIVGNYIAEVFT